MKRLATERLINRTRYLFTAFFVLTGFTSYRGGSDPRVYLAILLDSRSRVMGEVMAADSEGTPIPVRRT